MNLVTVFVTTDPNEANLVKMRLEAAGFHPEVLGEVAFTALYPGTFGKNEVKVLDTEAEDALALLEAEK